MITETYAEEVKGILARYPDPKSAALPLMHLAQREHGYMSKAAMHEVAEILGLDPTHILSLAGFYTLYHEEPVGKYVLEVCDDLACDLRGASDLVNMLKDKLDVEVGGTTADNLFTLKTVMCLAACDKAPMLQCNLAYHEKLDEAKVDKLIADIRAGKDETAVVDKIAAYAK
ncbi:MAG: NAD(P)H-dependent oxidoreductase subunit E [Chloroflexota bacterium]